MVVDVLVEFLGVVAVAAQRLDWVLVETSINKIYAGICTAMQMPRKCQWQKLASSLFRSVPDDRTTIGLKSCVFPYTIYSALCLVNPKTRFNVCYGSEEGKVPVPLL